MSDDIDRREYKRIAYHAPVEYIVGDERGHGQLVNISMGGIRIDTPFPLLKQGQTARVVFVLNSQPIALEVACRFAAVGFGIGAEFVNLTAEQTQRLRALIGEEAGP